MLDLVTNDKGITRSSTRCPRAPRRPARFSPPPAAPGAQHHLRRLLPLRGRHPCARTVRSSRSRPAGDLRPLLRSGLASCSSSQRGCSRGQVGESTSARVTSRSTSRSARRHGAIEQGRDGRSERASSSPSTTALSTRQRRARGGDPGERSHPQKRQDGQEGAEAGGDEEVNLHGVVGWFRHRSRRTLRTLANITLRFASLGGFTVNSLFFAIRFAILCKLRSDYTRTINPPGKPGMSRSSAYLVLLVTARRGRPRPVASCRRPPPPPTARRK